jgi:hypothetical protein
VIARVVEWVALHGGPPHGYEWDPTTGRRLGLLPAHAVPWERAQPHGPGTRVVAKLFGSFTNALLAAGHAARPTPALALQERVVAARALTADGQSRAAIAELLGVRADTVRDYLTATSCEGCGRFVVTRKPRCSQCALAAGRRALPSRDQVIARIRDWHQETGAPPTEPAWRRRRFNRWGDKWEREWPAWPSTQDVYRHFPTWAAAVSAAELRPFRRSWTRQQAADALRDLAANGETPTLEQIHAAARDDQCPWPSTLADLFGNNAAAMRAAGLTPRASALTSREEVLDALAAALVEYGRRPKQREWTADRRHPAIPTIRKYLGSYVEGFEQAAKRAGIELVDPMSDTGMLRTLATQLAARGGRITKADWDRDHLKPAGKTYALRFGSFANAVALATNPSATSRTAPGARRLPSDQ